jgi:hypothetical protein
VTNSTISGNTGGGVAHTPAGFGQTALQLLNVTIAGNSGGAGITAGGGVPPLLVQNTLVANNATGNCAGSTPPALSSRGSNLSSDTSCASLFTTTGDQNNVNPLLGPLANNGGPTQTQALQQGSPAINAVAAGSCPPPTTDQRGSPAPWAAPATLGPTSSSPPR